MYNIIIVFIGITFHFQIYGHFFCGTIKCKISAFSLIAVIKIGCNMLPELRVYPEHIIFLAAISRSQSTIIKRSLNALENCSKD